MQGVPAKEQGRGREREAIDQDSDRAARARNRLNAKEEGRKGVGSPDARVRTPEQLLESEERAEARARKRRAETLEIVRASQEETREEMEAKLKQIQDAIRPTLAAVEDQFKKIEETWLPTITETLMKKFEEKFIEHPGSHRRPEMEALHIEMQWPIRATIGSL